MLVCQQNDSMMYLIIPNLLESFLIPEAIKLHRTVCYFMATASRESPEMIVRCLKHSNYSRALELERFSDQCRNSSQLLLSKSELPLLELTESKHDFESAFDFINVSVLIFMCVVMSIWWSNYLL